MSSPASDSASAAREESGAVASHGSGEDISEECREARGQKRSPEQEEGEHAGAVVEGGATSAVFGGVKKFETRAVVERGTEPPNDVPVPHPALDDGMPLAFDPVDTLQDPRDSHTGRNRPQRELDAQASHRELEMQELPPERDRSQMNGQDSNSRLRKLHEELGSVVRYHNQQKASVQSWGAWLLQFCTLGNMLQAACAGVTILSLLLSAVHYHSNLFFVFVLCCSLVLQLWVQHATYERRSMRLGLRAQRFLSRLEWYIKNPFVASEQGVPVAGGANVWVQTTRPISAVQVISDKGRIALPTQMLVSGDRVVGPTDHWLVHQYCEGNDMNDSTVRDTPVAWQLSKVLSADLGRPQTQFEDQTTVVVHIMKWTVLCVLIVSVSSSVVLFFMYPQSTYRDALHLMVMRHVPVVVPFLPMSMFLPSVLLNIACNAYLSTKIHHKFNYSGAGGDNGDLLTDFPDGEKTPHRKSRWSSWKRFLSLILKTLRMRSGLGEDSEADNAPMMNADAETERAQRSQSISGRRGTGTPGWSTNMLAHMMQRLTVPKFDQDRALADGVINPCADLVDALGGATVLCFPDVDGIVCEPLMSPKQILLFSPDSKSADPSTASVSVIELLGAEKGAPCGACSFQVQRNMPFLFVDH